MRGWISGRRTCISVSVLLWHGPKISFYRLFFDLFSISFFPFMCLVYTEKTLWATCSPHSFYQRWFPLSQQQVRHMWGRFAVNTRRHKSSKPTWCCMTSHQLSELSNLKQRSEDLRDRHCLYRMNIYTSPSVSVSDPLQNMCQKGNKWAKVDKSIANKPFIRENTYISYGFQDNITVLYSLGVVFSECSTCSDICPHQLQSLNPHTWWISIKKSHC